MTSGADVGPTGTTGTPDQRGLLSALRAGDEAAFATLVRTYGGRMRAVALRLMGNDSDADDVVQEAFLSAFRSIDGFEGKARLSTWLHRITVNAGLMRLRRVKRRQEADVDSLMPTFRPAGCFVEEIEAWGVDEPSDPLEREELCAHVRECISRLPDSYRNALMLRDIEGLSNEFVAAELGITVNAAKIRIHRGRQALRALIEPRFVEAVG